MNMTFYRSNGRGNAKNCIYPKKCVVDNEDDCLEVMAFDHVCGKFADFRRSGENFLSSDVEVMEKLLFERTLSAYSSAVAR